MHRLTTLREPRADKTGARIRPAAEAATAVTECDGTRGAARRMAVQRIAHSPRQTAQRALIRRLKPDGPGVAADAVVQRAVGFEFQLPNTKLWRASPLPKDPQPQDFLPYGEKVFEHGGLFHAESDEGELEFVTREFEETPAGMVKLQQAVAGAANFAKNALGFNEWPTSVSRIRARYGSGTELGPHIEQNSPRVGSRAGATAALDESNLLAKPQATMGVALENTAGLAQKLIDIYGQSQDIDSTTKEMQTSLDWAEEFVVDHGVAVVASQSPAPPVVTNLATLISQFVGDSQGASLCHERYYQDARQHHAEQEMAYQIGEKAPSLYPKSSHTFMVRNSFKQMAGLLSSNEQDQARDLAIAMSTGYLSLSGDDRLYPGGYYSEDVSHNDYYTKAAESKVVYGPKISDWLGQIFGPPQEKADLPLEGTAQDRGMGGLKNMDTSPRTGGKTPLFELRSFQGPLSPDGWLPLAQAVHRVVASLQGSV